MKYAFFFAAFAALLSAAATASSSDKPFYLKVRFTGVPHENVSLKVFWYSQHNTQRTEERTVPGTRGLAFALLPYPKRVVVRATRSGCPKASEGTVSREFDPPVESVTIDFIEPCP